ncbi:class I SAM-dependent methyltransferase [Methylobacterium radiodurans]|uniref:Methyltransferase type 12 n=1 Tax=Methylobacterium radiodurans TaxID=2202828 RepID=A0A2U8VLY5_9HYPH|nr:class I SAM-dependent methyltransferase [Methylobacterium radiodurans]AWN34560.1 methyltransferase type 12 [Methylobacterium radiodurans]
MVRVAERLDAVAAGLAEQEGPEAHAALADRTIEALRALRDEAGAADWTAAAVPAVRAHAVGALMQVCPLTRYAFARPRGYPGDAGLLDLIYRHPDADGALAEASAAGRAAYAVTSGTAPCAAVRERRRILAGAIDRAAAERPGAAVLAVACGHLREAEISAGLRDGRVGRLLATDQDRESLARVADRADAPAVATRRLSVRDFIAAKATAEAEIGRFDLVYAAGLYDYLDDRIAARLTRKLFGLLRPGGRLLVGNFLTGLREEAYMDAVMDWQLIYRTQAQIRAFAAEISEVDLAGANYWADSAACVGYLELEHA